MAKPKYQLVVQFEANTLSDFDGLMQLVETTRTALAADEETVVDGHDLGMGEFNIFIHTNDPRAILKKVGETIDLERSGLPFAAGYRGFDEDIYTPLWPPHSLTFTVA